MSLAPRVASAALVALLLAALIVTSQVRSSSAQGELVTGYFFPHLVERVGRTTQPETFDTMIYLTFADTTTGTETVDVYLYDEKDDSILRSATGVEVCNPCTYVLTADDPTRQISIDHRIEQRGGFPRNRLGMWAFVLARGDDTFVQAFITNSRSGQNDVSITSVDPQWVDPYRGY